jgi:transposase-like protein
MKHMKQETRRKEAVVAEYLTGDASYRELSAKYGYSAATIYRWVRAAGEKKQIRENKDVSGEALLGIGGAESPQGEIKRLRRELKKAELHNKVLNKMMDIVRDEMGVDIRKKYGPGQ